MSCMMSVSSRIMPYTRSMVPIRIPIWFAMVSMSAMRSFMYFMFWI
ncbi:Uncharacterised protein [Mycobacteroides abscessus subsp. abscessus]|nr:Uncharacterised protein [Mycobacteroides abscessus subsp. abscessus]SHW34756.1 Uncharacterised protein [Mycobacteroides abscessus subsp. abscessus]SKU94137.1 Uncharacterised protein [Mycobacteroides abscessus subsp. abscessus]SKW06046.1 Uncharacterised protein [Mycobacteroides abscessus subsp. abscessus]